MFAVYPLDAEARSLARIRRASRAAGEAFECRVCHRSFSKEYNLLIHERTHKPVVDSNSNDSTDNNNHFAHNPAVCDLCGKVFKKQETMRNHRVSHSPPSVPKELRGFLTECITY